MEDAMMNSLVDIAKEKGIKKIVGYYYPTAKNGMVREFYRLQGFEKLTEDEEGNTKWCYEITSDYKDKNNVIKVEE